MTTITASQQRATTITPENVASWRLVACLRVVVPEALQAAIAKMPDESSSGRSEGEEDYADQVTSSSAYEITE